jgi:hypothetical protein
MPNTKFYIDSRCGTGTRETVTHMLPEIRAMLCDRLQVPTEACQFAVIEVAGLDDQPEISIELQLLPSPARTHQLLNCVAERLRDMLSTPTGLRVAVRMSAVDPVSYVALK